ncbi:MAG: Alkaline phosphatase [Parcubacteria bacterium C7867-004]|nr:MAG: Alkaline phosphatase [Parcubacteria bacterium C7867-004]
MHYGMTTGIMGAATDPSPPPPPPTPVDFAPLVITGSTGDDELYVYDGYGGSLFVAYGDAIAGFEGANRLILITTGGGMDTVVIESDYAITTNLGDGDDTFDGFYAFGNLTVFGDFGNDFIQGGNGNDQLFGGQGRDALFGDLGDDTVSGGDGSDALFGGSGRDSLNGGVGNDLLGFGLRDKVNGGDGDDTFQLTGDDGLRGAITLDFNDGDVLNFSRLPQIQVSDLSLVGGRLIVYNLNQGISCSFGGVEEFDTIQDAIESGQLVLSTLFDSDTFG